MTSESTAALNGVPDRVSHNGVGSTTGTEDVPVLIVGAGPCGLLMAHLLSKLGGKGIIIFLHCAGFVVRLTDTTVKSLVLEKYHQRLAAPKAHALCPRSLEICRQCGLDTREMRSLGTPRDDAYWVNFLTNLSGERIGVLPYERMDSGVLDDTPEVSIS